MATQTTAVGTIINDDPAQSSALLSQVSTGHEYQISSPIGASPLTIANWSSQDHFMLSQAVFDALGGHTGVLQDTLFHSSVDGSQGGADAVILYNSSTGGLYYDADAAGAGAAQQFALIQGAPPLSAHSLQIVP